MRSLYLSSQFAATFVVMPLIGAFLLIVTAVNAAPQSPTTSTSSSTQHQQKQGEASTISIQSAYPPPKKEPGSAGLLFISELF
jgi:hypothetical protein